MALPRGRQAAGSPRAREPLLEVEGELSEAGARLARLLPEGCFFHEDREDLRALLDTKGRRELVHTVHRGTALRADAGSRRAVHLSGWLAGDAERLLRAVLDGTEPERTRPEGSSGEGPHRLDPGRAIRGLERLVHLASLRAGPGASVSGSWVETEQRVLVARSGSGVGKDLRRAQRIRLEVSLGRERAVSEQIVRPGDAPDLECLAREAVERARARKEATEPVPGDCAVVFARGAGGVFFHEIVGHALEADTVERGDSVLALAEGSVGPAHLTVVDDPRRGRFPWRMDDEGFEPRATALLERGRVKGALHSEATAVRRGSLPTGHGRRASYREPVLPRMGCTFLAPGPLDPREVLEGIEEGVFVRRMETASADPRTGEALFFVSDGDLIRKGRVRQPLKGFYLCISTLVALASLDRVARDLAFDSCVGSCVRGGQALPTSVGAPTFRIGVAKVVC